MIVVWLWKAACQDPCVMKYTKYGCIEVSQLIQSLSTNTASTDHPADDDNTYMGKIGWWHYNPNDPTTKQSMTFVEQCNCLDELHPTLLLLSQQLMVISSSHEALHTKRFIPQLCYFCVMHMKRQIYSIHNVWSCCFNCCGGMYILYDIITSIFVSHRSLKESERIPLVAPSPMQSHLVVVGRLWTKSSAVSQSFYLHSTKVR